LRQEGIRHKEGSEWPRQRHPPAAGGRRAARTPARRTLARALVRRMLDPALSPRTRREAPPRKRLELGVVARVRPPRRTGGALPSRSRTPSPRARRALPGASRRSPRRQRCRWSQAAQHWPGWPEPPCRMPARVGGARCSAFRCRSGRASRCQRVTGSGATPGRSPERSPTPQSVPITSVSGLAALQAACSR
jgi:hypothetical protein